MSHSTVSHRWFHQIGNKRTNDNAYDSGNMFYRDKIIYSYGRHFAIAIRFDNKVVFNSKGYSSSTSKHIGHTRNAIDTFTHKVIYVPFKEAYYFEHDVNFKEVYKYIDFDYFVHDFEANKKKLGNARKPEKYTSEIDRLKNKLGEIFKTWRGSKTLATKNKGIRELLRFEFTPEVKEKMWALRKIELERQAKLREQRRAEEMETINKWVNGESNFLGFSVLREFDYNTLIRVKGDIIETSKGIKIDLQEGLRMFNLWQNNKVLGVEITTKDGHTWKCSKANGIIKFGCHEISYDQASEILGKY